MCCPAGWPHREYDDEADISAAAASSLASRDVAAGGGGGAAVTNGEGVLPSGTGGADSSSCRGTMVAASAGVRGWGRRGAAAVGQGVCVTGVDELAAESVESVSQGTVRNYMMPHTVAAAADMKRVNAAEEGEGALM
jgi:hypothetical protein